MIAKILSSNASFSAVFYNTDKVDKETAKLMKIVNFDGIDTETLLRPDDVKNYLKLVSSLNPRVKNPQFHATISCKGKEYSKEQLTDIACQWMDKMGYGKNPYIVVFHQDTDNNHVHIVSTRVGKDGKKIKSDFEKLNAVRHLESIMKIEPKAKISDDIKKIEGYSFSTVQQFKLLYETHGYDTAENDGRLKIYEGGTSVADYDIEALKEKASNFSLDEKRISQLKQIVRKYKSDIDGTLVAEHQKLAGNRKGNIIGFRSDLTDYLKEKFGLQFIFHFAQGKQPYGYTVIDHKSKAVYKGSQLMKLSEFINNKPVAVKVSKADEKALLMKHYNIESIQHLKLLSRYYKLPQYKVQANGRQLKSDEIAYYKDLLRFYLKHNSLDELGKLNIVPINESGTWYLLDTGSLNIVKATDVLDDDYVNRLMGEEQLSERYEQEQGGWLPTFGWDIADDVDDERVHGKERNRKSGKKR